MEEWSLPQLAKYTGTQIKRLREERNWSQDELAKKLDTTKTSISNYENGKRTPRFDGLYLLSTIFEVPIDTFFPTHKGTNHNLVFGTNHGVNGNNSGTINLRVSEDPKEYHAKAIEHRADGVALQQSAAESLAIFINQLRHVIFKMTTVELYLKHKSKEAGIDRKITTHFFRHTHISKLAEQGVPLHVIQKRVGHTKAETTREIYLHVTKKMQEDMEKQINNFSI